MARELLNHSRRASDSTCRMSKTILVVDDSATVRQQLRSFLEALGLEVIEAEDGAQGVSRAGEQQFDMLIVDVNMPIMNGIEMVGRVRQLASYQVTPILMLTTECAKSVMARGREAGATAWMLKPLKPELLLKGVKKVLALS